MIKKVLNYQAQQTARSRERTEAMDQQSGPQHGTITPQTRMGEIIERWPETVALLVANGFAPLADPAHQALVKTMPVTLELACARHGVSLAKMLGLLNAAVGGRED